MFAPGFPLCNSGLSCVCIGSRPGVPGAPVSARSQCSPAFRGLSWLCSPLAPHRIWKGSGNQKTEGGEPSVSISCFVSAVAYSALFRDWRNFGRTTHRAKKAVKPTSASAISMLPSPQVTLWLKLYGQAQFQELATPTNLQAIPVALCTNSGKQWAGGDAALQSYLLPHASGQGLCIDGVRSGHVLNSQAHRLENRYLFLGLAARDFAQHQLPQGTRDVL